MIGDTEKHLHNSSPNAIWDEAIVFNTLFCCIVSLEMLSGRSEESTTPLINDK